MERYTSEDEEKAYGGWCNFEDELDKAKQKYVVRAGIVTIAIAILAQILSPILHYINLLPALIFVRLAFSVWFHTVDREALKTTTRLAGYSMLLALCYVAYLSFNICSFILMLDQAIK